MIRRHSSLVAPTAAWLFAALLIHLAGQSAVAAAKPSASSSSVNQTAQPQRYNLIIMSLDTLRADFVSAFGAYQSLTPNINAIARRGAVFSSCYSQTPNTLSSHMSIFTGLYPLTHQVMYMNKDRLRPEVRTLTQDLKDAGYATYWYANLKAASLNPEIGFGRGFDRLNTDQWRFAGEQILSAGEQPFFMFVHTFHAHDPYIPIERRLKFLYNDHLQPDLHNNSEILRLAVFDRLHEEYCSNEDHLRRLFGDRVVNILEEFFDESDPQIKLEILRQIESEKGFELYAYIEQIYWQDIDPLNPKDVDMMRGLYRTKVFEADRLVYEIVSALDQAKLWDRTVVVLTSDHGEEFFEHSNHGHKQLYEETTHIPLVMWAPGMALKGRVIPALVQSVDILPTVLELLGLPPHPGAQGVSLQPLLAGKTDEIGRTETFQQWFEVNSSRNPAWHFLEYLEGQKELYDHVADPGDRNNLFLANREQAKYFNDAIRNWEKAYQPKLTIEFPFSSNFSDEEKEAIRRIGYLEVH